MTYHRGFSHSLFVLSGLALLLTWLVRRFRPHPGYSGRRLLLTVWLILFTHPVLDAFTSYGTQLFWPLMPIPTAWSSLFIIDPLYTLPLLVAVVVGLFNGLREQAWRVPAVALALSTLYIGFSLAGKYMAEQRVEAELARQGIVAEQLFITPTPLNSLLWRVIVLDGEHYHEALVGWFDDAPPQLQRLPRGTQLREQLLDSPAHQRLAWFTDGVLRYDQIGDRLIVTDLRLGMTGFHPFRFDFARLQDGQWQVHRHIERLPFERGEPEHLLVLLKRIWQPQLPVPLLAWAGELEKPLLSETGSR